MKSEPRLRAGHSAQGSRVVSATHAARSFSELLDRVCYRGESFVIERRGELVCEMSRVKPPARDERSFPEVPGLTVLRW
jgi:antitoxin (DNA-binding transcriptional repressor) of toxin-antitoxin stability system